MDIGTGLYLQYLRGNKANLVKLVELYSDGLVRFAYCFVEDAAAAEDIMEDTFAAIIASKRRFSPNASIKTYLYKIARNKCIDRQRRLKRIVPLCDIENVLGTETTNESIERDERKTMLYKCMQKLPKQYRDVLQLSYFEDFTVEEICTITKKNAKQVYNLIARAKAELRQLLVKEGIFQ